MAAEAEQLKAKRTKLLARVQAAREQRRQREMLEAREAVVVAEQQRDEADQALLDGAQERIRELREYYDGLTKKKGVIGQGIQALRDKEQELAKAQQKREADLKAAQSAISSAKVHANQAAKVYAAESLKSRKRQSLAERSFKEFRRVQSEAEEAAVEDELQDRLSVKTGQAA
jgi:hypothetical protein